MVRARSKHTTAASTCGCNNNFWQSSNQTCRYYTASLPKIEGERPWSFDRVKLVAIDVLLRFLLGHGVWLACDLHGLHPVHIRAIKSDPNAAVVEGLLNLWHIDRTVILC